MSGETTTTKDLIAEVNLGEEKHDEIPEKIGESKVESHFICLA